MALEDLKIDAYAQGVSDMPDDPSDAGYTAEQIKAIFDARSNNEIKEKHNALVDEITAHENGNNPHGTTKSDVGLSNVDNTSDKDKPVSAAQAAAIEKAVSEATKDFENHIKDKNPHGITKSDVGLGEVDNTADINKPVSTPQKEYIQEIIKKLPSESGGGDSNCRNIEDGEGIDSLVQVVEDSVSDIITHNFKAANYSLGNTGGTWFTQPEETATIENSGWELNTEQTSEAVAAHGGTGVDANYGIRTVFPYIDEGVSPALALDVYIENPGDYVIYVNAVSFDTSTNRTPIVEVYVNDVLLPTTIDTAQITTLNTAVLFVPGSADFVAGVNTIKFVCQTPLKEGGTTPYFNIESLVIRGKANSVTGAYSSAFGRYNNVSGHHAMAVNYDNDVSGKYSFSSGCGNVIEGHTCTGAGSGNVIEDETTGYTFISGNANKCTKDASFSFVGGGMENIIDAVRYAFIAGGRWNKVTGTYGFVAGYDNEAGGESSFIAGGYKNTASGDRSAIFGGKENTASGTDSVVIGAKSEATNAYSVSIGLSNSSRGIGTVAVGVGLEVVRNYNVVMGKYNVRNDNAVFIIGNGTSDAARSNALEVYSDGSIVISGVSFTSDMLNSLSNLAGTVDGNEVEY